MTVSLAEATAAARMVQSDLDANYRPLRADVRVLAAFVLAGDTERLREALAATTEALDDAIKAAVSAEWDQADYDAWDAARTAAEALLGDDR